MLDCFQSIISYMSFSGGVFLKTAVKSFYNDVFG